LSFGARVSSEVELARIEWRRGTRELTEDPQSVAGLHAEQVAIHGELTRSAGRPPICPISNADDCQEQAALLCTRYRA
jgi:hypothetical protein